jgi:hypothetical protein
MANGPGTALEAEMRSYANYESLTTKGNWKQQIMEIRKWKSSSLLDHDLSIFM